MLEILIHDRDGRPVGATPLPWPVLLDRQDMYDPVSDVTISVWSARADCDGTARKTAVLF